MNAVARERIRATLDEAKAYLATPAPSPLSESDTRANFIEPLIDALGWRGIGVVQREYYITNSREYIDFVLSDGGRRVMAIEAKSLLTGLTDQHAAQLVQYCAVDGIEWAALTNGRELQLFNTFLTPDLTAKRILRVDLNAYADDAEFDTLVEQLGLLSRERLTAPTGTQAWLQQKRLWTALHDLLLDPTPALTRQLGQALQARSINAVPADIAKALASLIGTQPLPQPRVTPPDPTQTRKPTDSVLVRRSAEPVSRHSSSSGRRTQAHYGITLADLVHAGVLPDGTPLVLIDSGHIQAIEATIDANGAIVWNGQSYGSPSHRAFIAHLGRASINGWLHWHARMNGPLIPLSELRRQYLDRRSR